MFCVNSAIAEGIYYLWDVYASNCFLSSLVERCSILHHSKEGTVQAAGKVDGVGPRFVCYSLAVQSHWTDCGPFPCAGTYAARLQENMGS